MCQINKINIRKWLSCVVAAAFIIGAVIAVAACGGAPSVPGSGQATPGHTLSGQTPVDVSKSGTSELDVNNRDIIDFSNGNFGFMRSYEASPDATPVRLSIVNEDDAAAGAGVIITPDRGGGVYIAVDLSSLLGERIVDLRMIEADVAVANDQVKEDFFAVSGEIIALDAEGYTVAENAWSVYLPEKNPNISRLELRDPMPSGPFNTLILSKTVDNAAAAGRAQMNLLISAIRFFDESGTLLPVNVDATFNAPEGFGEPDRSNLMATDDETAIEGAFGSSRGWGQAVCLMTIKNGGTFNPKALNNSVVTVYYSSASPPELILQSWTQGAPESAGWAKVPPARVNDSANIAQYIYEDMLSSFGTDDFETYLDQMYVGDTGADLKVYSVSVASKTGK